MAGEPGFEPGLTESESVVLPLNYSPKTRCAFAVTVPNRAGQYRQADVRAGIKIYVALQQDRAKWFQNL